MTPAQKISNPSYCQYYYIKIDGIRKCTDSTDVCVNAGYKFIDFTNKICKESCDNGYYQMEVQAPTSGGTFTQDFVKCYEDLNKALSDSDVKFYKIKTKQCWSENSLPNNPDIFINGESSIGSDKYEIVDECENYYYEDTSDNNRQHCIGNCGSSPFPSTLKHYLKGSKQCVGSCTTLSKNYYDPDTNECLDTCKGNSNYGFQIDIDTSNPAPLACLSSCTGMKSYYNYDSNICLSFCGEDNSNKKYHAEDGNECYSSCAEIPDGEYIYEGYPDNDGVITCQKAKPTCSSGEYFYTKLNGVKKCTSRNDCLESNKKYITDGECKESCDGNGHYLVERIHSSSPLKKYYECHDSRESALNSITGSEKIYCDTKKYKCWINKNNIPGEYYIGSPLTDDTSPDKFEVVEECDNFYYIDNSDGISFRKCIDDCSKLNPELYFIKGNKQCLPLTSTTSGETTCLSEQKYFYDEQNYECLDTCKGRPLNKFQIPLDVTPPTNPQKCLPSCPSTTPAKENYDYDSNECMGECNRNIGSKNKYRANDGTLCYPSCKDIPGNYIYEGESDYLCYKELTTATDCTYFYKKINGIMKCTTDLTVCANANFKYIIHGENGECLESCNGYYTVENFISTGTTPTRVSTGTYTCYSSLDNRALDPDGTGKLYCDSQTKRCLETLQSGYKIKSTIITNIYEVVSVCDYFYYTDGTEVKCTDKCQTVSKYFVDGNRECLSECATAPTSKYYYDPENKECLTTCIGQPFNKFQNKITGSTPTTAVSCLSSCSSGEYYDYDSNICISKCGEGTNDYKYHADGKFVCYPSCKEIPGEYIYEGVPGSTDNIITCYKTKDNLECTYFYEKVNGIRICTTSLSLEKCYYANYKYIMENGECKDNCDGYYQLEHSFTPVGGTVPLIVYKCYEKLVTLIGSLNLGTNEKLYCDKQIKKCWIKESLIDGYYIKSILPEASSSDNKFEIVKECPNFYYEDSTNGNTCIDSCKSTAPSLNYYFVNGNKQCYSSPTSCKDFNKYYYDPTTNECLDTCRGRIDQGFQDNVDTSNDPQECLSSCDVTSRTKKYYNIDSNICLTYCGEDGSNKKYHAYGKNACYSSCKDIPGEDYIYEVKDTSNYTCYKSSDYSTISSNCRFYYLKNGETKVCQTLDECKSMNNIYLIGNQCTDKCDGYFKFETTKSITVGSTTTTTTFFECYANQDDFYNHFNPTKNIYYNINLKKLWDDWNKVPNGYFITKDDNSQKYEVVDECEHFYYKKTVSSVNYYYCTSECKTIILEGDTTNRGLFFVNGRKNCEYSCTEFNLNKLYYNPDTNECLETCKGLPGKEFADKIDTTSTTQPCKNSCGTNYHDFGSNICFTTCGNGDINKLYRIDTTDVNKYICFSSCSEIPGGEYKYELNKKCYKSSTDVPSDTCEYYYFKANG